MGIDLHQLAKNITLDLSGSDCSQPFTPECDVYKVMGKVYLMSFHLDHIAVLNLKVDPIHAEMLRDSYPFIRTGYHMNKRHWISVYEDEKINCDLIEDLILSSYQLVASKLSKTEKQDLALLQSMPKP